MSASATIAALLSAILWGVAYVASGEALRRNPPVTVYAGLLVAVVTVMPLAWVAGRPWRWPQAGDWRDLILASASAAAAMWLGYLAIARSSALQASIVDISYPLWAVLAGWLLYSQKMPNAQTLLGGAFILLGGALILFSEKP